jgi:hypothetical protein
VDPAFTWDQPKAPIRRRARAAAPSGETAPSPGRITLREAEHRFGVSVATLRTWARKGSVDAVMTDADAGRQWMVTPESVAHHLSRTPRPTPRSTPKTPRRPATGPTGDGTAMLVPRDAWDRLMDQLGNLHEAGLLLAEARERAAKFETEAGFLRERLGELRAERDELKQAAGRRPPASGSEPPHRRSWWRR